MLLNYLNLPRADLVSTSFVYLFIYFILINRITFFPDALNLNVFTTAKKNLGLR